eukprot:1357967-Pleurochrysis_carterae.AAC.1
MKVVQVGVHVASCGPRSGAGCKSSIPSCGIQVRETMNARLPAALRSSRRSAGKASLFRTSTRSPAH